MTEREKLIEILNQTQIESMTAKNNISNEYLADRLLANGVKLLPCKIYDSIYYVKNDTIMWGYVSRISLNRSGNFVITVKYVDRDSESPDKYGNFKLSSIGETLFLNLEEAKQAVIKRLNDRLQEVKRNASPNTGKKVMPCEQHQ